MAEEFPRGQDQRATGESPQEADRLDPAGLPDKKKTDLAIAIARGKSIGKWAAEQSIPRRTAYNWASDRNVQAVAREWRRRAYEETIGLYAKHSTWALELVVALAAGATSESVRLAAARSLLTDAIKVNAFSDVQDRLAEIEEEIDDEPSDAADPETGQG
jgi:hypothetical protein